MFRNVRAQGLPMNTIVIALLVVIVLVVVILAFTGNLSGSNDAFQEYSRTCQLSCNTLGYEGDLISSGGTCSGTSRSYNEQFDCCCSKSGSSGNSGGGTLGNDNVVEGATIGNVISENLNSGAR